MPESNPARTFEGVNAVEAAEQRAFERGQQSATLKAQLDSHEQRLNAINGSIQRSAAAQEDTVSKLKDLAGTVEQTAAIAKARAEDAQKAAEKQVSTRTFVIGLAGAVAAIGTLLAATGHV